MLALELLVVSDLALLAPLAHLDPEHEAVVVVAVPQKPAGGAGLEEPHLVPTPVVA